MPRQARSLLGLAAVLLFLGACDRGSTVVRREGQPDVQLVDSTDAGMIAAVDSARRSTDDLIRRVRTPPATQVGLGVKVRVAEGDVVEHLWITDVGFDGSLLHGIVNNDPIELEGTKLGDTVRVRPSEISDWMAIDGGRLVAGYSIRLLRARMNPVDRVRFDSSVGFAIDR